MNQIEDEYLPWTAKIPSWLMFVAIFTCFWSVGPMVGLYLSDWVKERTNRRRAETLYLVLMIPAFVVIASWILPGRFQLSHHIVDILVTFWVILWIAAGFVLRAEIRNCLRQREGFDLEIKPVWTALLSVVYMNYCLATLRADRAGRNISFLL